MVIFDADLPQIFLLQAPTEPKAKPTMFQSGKTTFSKTSKVSPVLVPSGPPMNKRQQELQKQVSTV